MKSSIKSPTLLPLESGAYEYMGDKATVTPIASSDKGKKHRSPSYPGIDLATAISRAEIFHKHERRNPASFPVIAHHWGYKPTTSGALTTAAALKSFGLIRELEPGAGGRVLQLTDLALRIILDQRPGSPEREAAIKESALRPKIYAELWRRYNGVLPSPGELRHRLIFDYSFNENSVDDFIKKFQQTISFAKLTHSDTMSVSEGESAEEDDFVPNIQIGDHVQWDSQGVLQFASPRKVRAISEDRRFAFVEGSDTGLPVEQLKVEAAPAHEIEAPHSGRDSSANPNPKPILTQELVISIPRNFRVEISVRSDELKREDLSRIKNQFNRWIEGLEEAFD